MVWTLVDCNLHLRRVKSPGHEYGSVRLVGALSAKTTIVWNGSDCLGEA